MKKTQLTLVTIIILISLIFFVSPALADKHRIVHISDPHVILDTADTRLSDMVAWVVANETDATNGDIEAVIISGDFANYPDDGNQSILQKASNAVDGLRVAGIPFLVTMGNHDYDVNYTGYGQNKISSNFGTAFPESKFAFMTNYTSQGADPLASAVTRPQNKAFTFGVGSETWLAIGIDNCPLQDALDWAEYVLDNYTYDRAIFATHDYMSGDCNGTQRGKTSDTGYWCTDQEYTNSGEQIFQKLVKNYPDILFVLSGHSWDLTDPLKQGSSRRVDVIDGKAINQIRTNYQAYTGVIGHNYYFKIFTIDTSSNRITVKSYSTDQDTYDRDCRSSFILYDDTNLCECVHETTECSAEAECGVEVDECGNDIPCGTCEAGETCTDNMCEDDTVPPVGDVEIALDDYNLSIWDFSGTYPEQPVPNGTAEFTLIQDAKGKITGSGVKSYTSSEYGISIEDIALDIKGKAKGKNNIVTVKVKTKGGRENAPYQGSTYNIKSKDKITLVLNAEKDALVGTSKGKVCAKGKGCESGSNNIEIVLLPEMTGDAVVLIDSDNQTGKFSGNGELILSNQDEYPFSYKGKINSKKGETKYQLKGDNGIKLKIVMDEADNMTQINGKVFGQQLKYKQE